MTTHTSWTAIKRNGRWYVARKDDTSIRLPWGEGSSWTANFRLRRLAAEWAAKRGIELS